MPDLPAPSESLNHTRYPCAGSCVCRNQNFCAPATLTLRLSEYRSDRSGALLLQISKPQFAGVVAPEMQERAPVLAKQRAGFGSYQLCVRAFAWLPTRGTENNDSERNLSDFDYQAHNYHEYRIYPDRGFPTPSCSQPPTSSAGSARQLFGWRVRSSDRKSINPGTGRVVQSIHR